MKENKEYQTERDFVRKFLGNEVCDEEIELQCDMLSKFKHHLIDERLYPVDSKWKDIKDCVPTDSRAVLGIMKDTFDTYICFYKKSQNVFLVYGAGVDPISDMKVTHWMPLPAPPNQQYDTNVMLSPETNAVTITEGEKERYKLGYKDGWSECEKWMQEQLKNK